MKNEINGAVASKINWTAGLQALANVAVYVLVQWGYIPQTAVLDSLVVANTVSALLIGTFRTWFTKP